MFGSNLAPGPRSAIGTLRRTIISVLEGMLTLVDDNGPHEMTSGMFAAFPAGEANGHHIQNRSAVPGIFLVVGSRRTGEETIHYPDHDFGPIQK